MSELTHPVVKAARVLLPLTAVLLAALQFPYLFGLGLMENPVFGTVALLAPATALAALGCAPWFPWLSTGLFVVSVWSGVAVGDLLFVILAAMPCTMAAVLALRWLTTVVCGVLSLAALVVGPTLSVELATPLQIFFLALAVLVGTVAGLIAKGIYRRRKARQAEVAALKARLAAVRHDERTALARQLHDLIGHSLSSIALQGEAYSDSEDPAELRSVLSRMRGESVKAVDQLQLLVGLLRDAALEADGPSDLNTMAEPPSQVLARLVAEMESLGFQVTSSCDQRADSLGPVLRTFLGRFLTESVTNIQRYAEPATHCTLTISLSG
ncbi:MAG: hypothetical protein CSA64_05465, partial [Arachnia propionica]